MEDHKQHMAQDHSKHSPSKAQHSGTDHSMHNMEDHAAHTAHQGHTMPATSQGDHSAHADHGTDHTGHEQMFRVRFWWSLLLSIPVLLYSEMIQMWLGFTPSAFPFSAWIPFVFSVIIFAGCPIALRQLRQLPGYRRSALPPRCPSPSNSAQPVYFPDG